MVAGEGGVGRKLTVRWDDGEGTGKGEERGRKRELLLLLLNIFAILYINEFV